jgi:hypothetical protein
MSGKEHYKNKVLKGTTPSMRSLIVFCSFWLENKTWQSTPILAIYPKPTPGFNLEMRERLILHEVN